MEFNIHQSLFVLITVLMVNYTLSQKNKQQSQIRRLGQYPTFPNHITLSGFSSGGTFAQQLQISYSSIFRGIAVFSHAYYRCGPGDGITTNYDNACTKIGDPRIRPYDYQNALKDIQLYSGLGLIENPTNLQNKKLYVYVGTDNYLFSTDMSLTILKIYEPFIQNPFAIRTRVQSANLTLPTNHFGGSCSADSSGNFSISNCGISGPYEALKFLLGRAIRNVPQRDSQFPLQLQPLQTFDQTEFSNEIEGRSDMDKIGFIYIPSRCRQYPCLIHFYFHGCQTGREFVAENHVRNSGYLEIAELNDIIMIFPQALSSPENEIGCWDTYGVTGLLYATQRGAQVSILRKMISRILGEDYYSE